MKMRSLKRMSLVKKRNLAEEDQCDDEEESEDDGESNEVGGFKESIASPLELGREEELSSSPLSGAG
jgi:hypothetical protein